MTATLFDYLVLKEVKFGLSSGLHTRLAHGTRVPGDEAASWGGRSVDRLVGAGILAPVPAEDGAADAFWAALDGTAPDAAVDEVVEDEVPQSDPTKADVTFPQHVVAAKFLLSDGTEVQGKAAALEAQAKLDEAVDA